MDRRGPAVSDKMPRCHLTWPILCLWLVGLLAAKRTLPTFCRAPRHALSYSGPGLDNAYNPVPEAYTPNIGHQPHVSLVAGSREILQFSRVVLLMEDAHERLLSLVRPAAAKWQPQGGIPGREGSWE